MQEGEKSPSKENVIVKMEETEGIYIIESGKCCIQHPNDEFMAKELTRWDFFGECDLLKVVGYTYFGDIVVTSDKVQVLFISTSAFKKIPVYEQFVMKQYCQARQDIAMLAYLYSTRYKIDIKEYTSFY